MTDKIIELLTRLEKADKAAERERQKVLNAGKDIEKETKKKSVMAHKLLDCRNHDENSIILRKTADLGTIIVSLERCDEQKQVDFQTDSKENTINSKVIVGADGPLSLVSSLCSLGRGASPPASAANCSASSSV